jgi:SAM-dependent methyltransferase
MPGYASRIPPRFTPWERYRRAAAESIGALLDQEEAEGSHPLGRTIDLGCGRGQYTAELARREWDAVGIDNVPRAIEAANRRGRLRCPLRGG